MGKPELSRDPHPQGDSHQQMFRFPSQAGAHLPDAKEVGPDPLSTPKDSQANGSFPPHHPFLVAPPWPHQFRAPLPLPSYSQLIAEWPGLVLLLCLTFVLLCTLAGLLGGQLPDFSKPLLVRG